jgi:D-glycero-D-manno-heptose 1,7-bisphosphate phosphatase
VINLDHGYVHRAAQTEWVPGIFELCRIAKDLGYDLVVVTNQAGIARGYYGETEFAEYTRWMHGEFSKRGVPILATYHCPHHPSEGIGELRRDCDCRKPNPGMILRAQREHAIYLARSALIGDKQSDIDAARAAGVGHAFLFKADGGGSDMASAMKQAAAWLTDVG